MNKHCFRLLFSKTLGFLIPVAEISTAQRKPGQTRGPANAATTGLQRGWAIKALPFALLGLLPHAFADIVVAPNQQTSVTQSGNGVPVVDIANPNNQGLSHNRFTQFNVNDPGVIFNNSLRDGVSAIGNQVMHNTNLTREANAILTEVTGNGPSVLAGTLEVFGGRADVLIANPNGIILNGVTTLNTSGLVVSTGRVNPDTLEFTVDQKNSSRVIIGGGGVNTENLSYFDIVARAIDINGEVGSTTRNTEILALTGLNTYQGLTRNYRTDAEHGQNAPQVAIQGGAAGAMHGRFINLISTESGAGVRHNGLIHAARDITVSASGDITLTAVQAGNDVALTGTRDITLGDGNTGNGLEAGGRLALNASENIAIHNDVQTDRFTATAKNLQITAATLNADGKQQDGTSKAITLNVDAFTLMGEMQLYDGEGEVLATDPLVTKEGKLQLKLVGGKYSDEFTLKTTAKLLSGGGIDITAKQFNNHEGIIHDSSTRGVSITADHVLNQGLVQTQGDLTLSTAVLDNLCAGGAAVTGGEQTICGGFFAAGNGNVKAGQMTSNGGLVAGRLLNLELGEGTHTIGAYGGIGAGQNLVAKALAGKNATLNVAGEMTSGRDMNVTLGALTTTSETSVKAGGNAIFKIDKTFTNSGEINTAGNLTISAQDMSNAAGAKLQTGSDALINVRNTLLNAKGSEIATLGDFTMTAGGSMATAATINVAGDNALIHADGALVNAAGSIITTKNLDMKSGAALTNEVSALTYADGQLTLESVGDMINHQDSQLSSGGKLIATVGGTLTNSAGSFLDALDVSVKAQKILNTGGSVINGLNALNIVTSGDFTNEGKSSVHSKKAITLTSAGVVSNDNATLNAPTLKINGKTVSNINKGEMVGNTVGVTATDTFNSLSGSILKGDNVALDATTIKGADSNVLARENLDVTTREIQSSATLHSLITATLNAKKGEDLHIGTGFKSPTAGKLLTVNTHDLSVDGSLKNPGDLVINASGKVRNNGEIIGGGDLTLTAKGAIDNLAKALVWAAKDAVLNTATTLSNGTGALIRANWNLALIAKTAVLNQAGQIDASGNVAIDTPTLTNGSDLAGKLTVKVIGNDQGYVHTNNWYGEHLWGLYNQYFHIELSTPRYSGEALTVQQGVIKAGGNLLLNQTAHIGVPASVHNVGGLIAAAGDVTVDGDLENTGIGKSISLKDYMKASPAFARHTFPDNPKPDGPALYTTLYDLFDKNLLAPNYVPTHADYERARGDVDAYIRLNEGFAPGQVIQGEDRWLYALRDVSTPEENALFGAVFGSDWKNLNIDAMRDRWAAFKAAPDKTLDIYADKQAELSAGGNFVQTGGSLTNGSGENWGKNRTINVQIGDEKLVTVDGDLNALFNRDSAFDLSKDTNLNALRDAINSARVQQELMSNNPLFSANPPPPDLRQVGVNGDLTPVAGGTFKGFYPLYTSRVSFNPKDYVGSDYLFKALGYNPEKTVTVLGDAYFDNELIVRTIEHTVGNFFAVNHQWSGNTLVQNLMDNAASEAARLGLVVGQPLTTGQYDNLDSDIVWYEPQVVNGISVLAPKVYVSRSTLFARQQDQRNGALLTAKNVLIDASAVNNVNGIIRSENDTLVYAKGDLNNVAQGGTDTGIYAGDHGRLVMAADGAITNRGGNAAGLQQTLVSATGVSNSATTGYAADGSLYVRDDGLLGAGLTQAGTARKAAELASTAKPADAIASIPAPSTPVATALASSTDGVKSAAVVAEAKSEARTAFESLKAQSKAGTLAKDTESSLGIASGGNIELAGSAASADNVTLQAWGDVTLKDIHEVGSNFSSAYSAGVFSSKSVTDTSAWAASKGNEVNANQLTIRTGGNLSMTGGALNTQDSAVSVGGDMTVAAAKDLAFHDVVTKTTEFVAGVNVGAGGHEASASWGSTTGGKSYAGRGAAAQALAINGSAGQRAIQNANAGRGATTGTNFKLGFETVTSTDTSRAKTFTNAQLNLGSGKADVGGTFDFGGADINRQAQVSAADRAAIAAGKPPSFNAELPTLAIKAGDIKTTKFESTSSQTFDKQTVFAGLMGEAHSTVVDVTTNIANRAQKASDGMKAVGGDDTGDDALNGALIAEEAIGNITQLALGEVAGASVTLGAKITNDHGESNSTRQNVNHAGGNLSLTSTQGNIDLNGVNIAGAKVALDSAAAINQTAAKSTQMDKSKNDTYTVGLTASIGATMNGNAGVGLSVEVNGSHDRTETHATGYTNGQLSGTEVSLNAKGDHTLVGANINGNAVDLNIGGKQTIASVQDTSTMDHERGSWGISFGAAWDLKELVAGNFIPKPTGSVNASGGKDYDNSAITAMQSGIDAGTLNLAVAGAQNLTGAHVINTSGNGTFTVGGVTTAGSLTDTRDKDGGYGGAGGGINRNGLGTVTVQGGRVDQVHYNAEQRATIDLNSGAADFKKGLSGRLNLDGKKLVQVNRDVVIQGSDIKLEITPSAVTPSKKGPSKINNDTDIPEIVVTPPTRPGTPVKPLNENRVDVADSAPPPTASKPATPTMDIVDGPVISKPPAKPAIGNSVDVADGPPQGKPGKPLEDGGQEIATRTPPETGAPDIETVTPPRRGSDTNARYMTEYATGQNLRKAADMLSNSNKAVQAELKAHPLKIIVRGEDGGKTEFEVSDAKSLMALNGVQVVTGSQKEITNFQPGYGASSNLYIKVTPLPGGGFKTTFTPTKPQTRHSI